MANPKTLADPTTRTKPPFGHIVSLAIKSAGKDRNTYSNKANDCLSSGVKANERISSHKSTAFPCDHTKHRIARMARKRALKKAYRPKGAAPSDSSDDEILTRPDSKLVNADLVVSLLMLSYPQIAASLTTPLGNPLQPSCMGTLQRRRQGRDS